MCVVTNLSFAHAYEVVMEFDFMEKYGRYYYPGSRESGRDGIAIMVSSKYEKWIGIFEPSYKKAHSGIYSMPNPDFLSVVSSGSGVIVNSADPNDYEQITIHPIINVVVHEYQRRIAYIGFTEMIVYSESGKVWEEAQISSDGISVGRIDDDGFYCVIWNAPENREESIYIDLKNEQIKLEKG